MRFLRSLPAEKSAGLQDHTTSPSASQAHLVKSAARVHRIPCPTFVTIAKRPSVSGRDGEGYAGDLRQKGTEIFLKEGLDRQITEQPVGQNHRIGPFQDHNWF
jgi:hypothetical protein